MSQTLELNQRHHIMHLLPDNKSGRMAWTVLKELHAPTSVAATLMMERELSALRLSKGEPAQPVLDKMRDLFANLATTGFTYPEQTKCLKMLLLLPESFFHIGEQGEQGDATAKVGAELHPLDYWVLDTGVAWMMTPHKDLLDDVRAATINEVCSASGHALKVAGAERAAFKGADGKPVVLHNVLLVPDLKASLISLRKIAKAGVSTSTDGAHTYKGHLGSWVPWDLHEGKDVYRSIHCRRGDRKQGK
ncbi:unnamed protein product [Closterium sp. NIES-53]